LYISNGLEIQKNSLYNEAAQTAQAVIVEYKKDFL